MREEWAEEDEITQFIFHWPKLLGDTPKVTGAQISAILHYPKCSLDW